MLHGHFWRLGPLYSSPCLLFTLFLLVKMYGVESLEHYFFFIVWFLAHLWFLIGTWPNSLCSQIIIYWTYLHWAHAEEKNNNRMQEAVSASDWKLAFDYFSGLCYERQMHSLPFVAMNTFPELLKIQSFTFLNLTSFSASPELLSNNLSIKSIFHAAFQKLLILAISSY